MPQIMTVRGPIDPEDLGFTSCGTWAVSVEEIDSLEDLSLKRDPKQENLAHCLLDFNAGESKTQRRKRAQILAIYASERGCLFDPFN